MPVGSGGGDNSVSPTGISYSPQFRSHQETKMEAQSNTKIDIYNLTKKKDCEQSSDK